MHSPHMNKNLPSQIALLKEEIASLRRGGLEATQVCQDRVQMLASLYNEWAATLG